MTESLEHNLLKSWSPEERARLDAVPEPTTLDHTNRDHEYLFFKKVRWLARPGSDRFHGST